MPSVAFHIGVHKSATSHLQRSLLKVSDDLIAAGVRFLGPRSFRAPNPTIVARFGLSDALKGGGPGSGAAALQDLTQGADRLILSEENFIGPLNHPRGLPLGPRYPDADARVTALSAAIAQPIDLFIALRQPTSLLNSAYCQMLLGGRVQPPLQYQDNNPVEEVDWVDLIARLAGAKGVRSLTVWRYEDYAQVYPLIITRMIGPDCPVAVPPIPRRVNQGLSAVAVAEVLHRARLRPGPVNAQDIRKLLPVERRYPSYDGYTAAQHAASARSYAAQWDAIGAIAGVTRLTA